MVSFILPGNSATDAYEVANSLRFNSASSDHLLIVPSSAGNKQTWTWSAWVKRGVLGTRQVLFSGYDQAAGLGESIEFTSADKLEYDLDIAGTDFTVTSSMVFRDVSAWYHILFIKDVTESTETNRIKVYVNGVQISLVENANGYPAENATNGLINTAGNYEHHVGCLVPNSSFFDGYMCEVVFIDGTAQTNTDFGEFDSDSPNIWKPKDVSGLTFGTNGFYLDFENSGSLGADVSGNGNNFTVNNLTSIDQSTDTCTNNFVTWNPLDTGRTYSGTIDLSEGNLRQSNANDASLISTVAVNKGKWYMEFKVENSHNTRTFGIIDMAESNGYVGHHSVASAVSYGYKSSTGTLYIGTSEQASSVGTTGAGDIVSMAIDLDSSTKTIKWQKNGSDLSGTTQLTISHTGYYWAISCRCDGGQNITANFGSPAYSISSGNSDADGHGNFEYAVPSGYFALCTKNLAEYG